MKSPRDLIQRFPNWPVHHYNLAAALARQNMHKALESLETAIRHGFSSTIVMERDPDLDTLRQLPRFQELLAKIERESKATAGTARPSIAPKLVQERLEIVDESNTAWDPRSNMLIATFQFSETPETEHVYRGVDRISELLNSWYEGRGRWKSRGPL